MPPPSPAEAFPALAPKFELVDRMRSALLESLMTSAPVPGSTITEPDVVRLEIMPILMMPSRFTSRRMRLLLAFSSRFVRGKCRARMRHGVHSSPRGAPCRWPSGSPW